MKPETATRSVVRAMVNPLYNEAVLLKHILEHDVDPAHVHISIYGEFMYNMGARLEVNPCQTCTTSVDVAFYLSFSLFLLLRLGEDPDQHEDKSWAGELSVFSYCFNY